MKNKITISFLLIFFFIAPLAHADEREAKLLYEKGVELEGLNETLTEQAEKACYWGKKGSHDCMQKHIDRYNAKYGPGSFELLPQLNVIRYTGTHHRELMQKYSKSRYAAAAEYRLLTRNLVGLPDAVLGRVENFIRRYPSGEWNRKGRLLLGRLNQDIWWIHRKWSWVLYNRRISETELIRKSEKYRHEAMRIFQELSKSSRTEEGKLAKQEYRLLKSFKDDGRIYGIINESLVGSQKSPQ